MSKLAPVPIEKSSVVETPILVELTKINMNLEFIVKDLRRLEQKTDNIEAKMNAGFKEVDDKFIKLEDKMNAGFKELRSEMETGFQEIRADNAKQDTKIAVINTKLAVMIGFALFISGAILSIIKWPQLFNLFK